MDTRERLIETTRQLLWERGYVGTSPNAIQRRSGAGQGSMYHHFRGKADLALAAISREAAELRARAEAELSGPGTPLQRITNYLRRERQALRGCPVGHLTQDPDLMNDPVLCRPVDETFAWLRTQLTSVLAEAKAGEELDPVLDPAATATALLAVLQGGYVLARAAADARVFTQAIEGALSLLTTHAR